MTLTRLVDRFRRRRVELISLCNAEALKWISLHNAEAQRERMAPAEGHVAEHLARCAPGLHRIRSPEDATLLAREAVAALLLSSQGRELAREVLRTIPVEAP